MEDRLAWIVDMLDGGKEAGQAVLLAKSWNEGCWANVREDRGTCGKASNGSERMERGREGGGVDEVKPETAHRRAFYWIRPAMSLS